MEHLLDLQVLLSVRSLHIVDDIVLLAFISSMPKEKKNRDGTFCCLDVIFGDKMRGGAYCEMVFLYVD